VTGLSSVGSNPTDTRNGDVLTVSRPDVINALTREATLRAVHDGWQVSQDARLRSMTVTRFSESLASGEPGRRSPHSCGQGLPTWHRGGPGVSSRLILVRSTKGSNTARRIRTRGAGHDRTQQGATGPEYAPAKRGKGWAGRFDSGCASVRIDDLTTSAPCD